MDLTGLRAGYLSALVRGLDGAPGGRAGDAASTVASTADASGVAVFGAFVVARWADSTAAVDSTVVADFTVVVGTDKPSVFLLQKGATLAKGRSSFSTEFA
jgi:hypothetical protein